MRIYIVRHGQSEGNLNKSHQSDDTPLSEQGLQQAKFLANRFKSIPIDVIWSSPFLRTQQTAQEIAHSTGLTINYSELLVEHRNPSQVTGKPHGSPESQAYINQRNVNSLDLKWQYSDEETASDFRHRVANALMFITNQPQQNILIVSHGEVIREMITIMAMGLKYSPEERLALRKFLKLSNTGITVCDYENDEWQLITWNDKAHLGE